MFHHLSHPAYTGQHLYTQHLVHGKPQRNAALKDTEQHSPTRSTKRHKKANNTKHFIPTCQENTTNKKRIYSALPRFRHRSMSRWQRPVGWCTRQEVPAYPWQRTRQHCRRNASEVDRRAVFAKRCREMACRDAQRPPKKRPLLSPEA